ncbi:MAG: N-acetylmuramoyl-L-alanine amidase [Thermonemataceae bacterium]
MLLIILALWNLISVKAQNPIAAHFKDKLEKYLVKHPQVRDHIVVNDRGVYMFASLQEKRANKPEYVFSWQQVTLFKQLCSRAPQVARQLYLKNVPFNLPDSLKKTVRSHPTPLDTLPLRGVRIAIDPGHFAGDEKTARMEGRYIDITLANGTRVLFYESVLAWGTAKVLEKKLEAAGAKVLITRQKANLTALDMTFQQWYARYVRAQTSRGKRYLSPKQAFRQVLRAQDFKARVLKINAFQPDLTLIIHYNVDATNSPWQQPTNKNFAMAFVGGAFYQEELNTPEKRFQLLRLLLTEDVEKSVRLSGHILQEHRRVLQVPTIEEPNQQSYLDKYCLYTGTKGVYTRNLSLSREIFGALCYGESLLQDNIQEIQQLNQKSFVIDKWYFPARVNQVAEAYYRGIKNYWLSTNR